MNCRAKGNNYELKIRKELTEILGKEVLTSRNASRIQDSLKVDLVNTKPFNIQIKAQERGPNYFEVLASMPEDHNYNLLFHKRNHSGEVVVMNKADFYELLNMLLVQNIV